MHNFTLILLLLTLTFSVIAKDGGETPERIHEFAEAFINATKCACDLIESDKTKEYFKCSGRGYSLDDDTNISRSKRRTRKLRCTSKGKNLQIDLNDPVITCKLSHDPDSLKEVDCVLKRDADKFWSKRKVKNYLSYIKDTQKCYLDIKGSSCPYQNQFKEDDSQDENS